MNFVVLTAIISAANSGLYASTRMLWSLANEGTIPSVIAKTNKRGIPVFAFALKYAWWDFSFTFQHLCGWNSLFSLGFCFWIGGRLCINVNLN